MLTVPDDVDLPTRLGDDHRFAHRQCLGDDGHAGVLNDIPERDDDDPCARVEISKSSMGQLMMNCHLTVVPFAGQPRATPRAGENGASDCDL